MARNDEARGRGARRPREIPRRGWKDVLSRIKQQVSDDNVSILAAGLAFYGMLAIFPGLIALISLYGLLASPEALQQQLDQIAALMPASGAEIVQNQMRAIAEREGGLSWGLVLGVLGALWTASAGTQALITGVNVAYDERETRGFFKLRGLALTLTLGLIAFFIVAVGIIAFLPTALDYVGLGDAMRAVLEWGRWPLLALMVVGGLAVLYRVGPDRRGAQRQWLTWGSVLATVLWLAASAGFSWYAESFGSYNETYGAIGAVIVLLLWLYISGFAVLLGAEVNSEIEHQTSVDSTVGEERPMGEREAYVADTVGETAEEAKRREAEGDEKHAA